MTTRFEQIKNMNINEIAELLANMYTICERETRCSQCPHQDWCDCTDAEDYKKWLNKEGNLL